MNNDLLYTLDPYIVSILFKTKTDEATLEIYSKLAQSLDMVLKGTIKEFLTENGFNDEDVKKVVEAEDFDTLELKFKPYLQNIILAKRIEANHRQFIKLYYDQLLPNLSNEEKQQLEKYLQDSEEVLKLKKGEILEGVKALKEILEENGVQTYDELRAKLEDTNLPNSLPDENPPKDNLETLPALSPDNVKPEQAGVDTSTPSIVNSNVTPNLEPIPIPVVPGEGGDSVQNVVEVKPEVPAENTLPPITDTLATPVKATIIEDEPAPDVSVLQAEPEAAPAETTAVPAAGEQQKVNAVSQLQNMGIDLNDALQHPPQS